MSEGGATAAARVGCVRYLNSKPLIPDPADGISLETPASLADGLHNGRLDVALAPIFELISYPDEYAVVDGVAIACQGPVYSVIIAHGGEISGLRTLYIDPASRTSVNLQRVLLAEFYGLVPHPEPLPAEGPAPVPREGEGVLLIGDRAIDYRAEHGDRCRYFDLGEAWREATGLPFVFAAWLMRLQTPDAAAVADRLRAWRDAGVKRIEAIARAETRHSPEFTRFYLTECIRYTLGDAEKRAIREYARLLYKHGVLTGAKPPGEFRWI
jgi:chorismate dehydratase